MTIMKQHLIERLREKKHRKDSGLFVVEGEKCVLELLNSDFEIREMWATREFTNAYQDKIKLKTKINLLDLGEIRKISNLEENHSVIAIALQKKYNEPTVNESKIILVLDGIKDPGNLGTIIRIADWYGIGDIVVSEDSVDTWNNKVISASMGSFTRVKIFQTNLFNFLNKQTCPIFAGTLNGKNSHKIEFPNTGILLMGSESHGISENIEHFITQKITIPRFGNAESLNVGVATGIILDSWKRKI
jgi:TrmH family RNA methyltransferase